MNIDIGQLGFLGTVILILIAFMVVLYMVPLRLWVAAQAARAQVGIVQLIGMRLRRVPPERIVNPRINAVKAGLDIPTDSLEAHFLAGGNVEAVVNALISADKAGITLDFQRAAAIDLAGRNVFEAVQMSVNPKVIETPDIPGVAMDGIQLIAKARITVRTNLARLVGGAGEQTIIARVGEGVVATIGSSKDYKEVLEHPDRISKTVLAKGLDAGTAYEIVSIDIMDVNVGANVGAKLQIDQAEANKQVAQAQAESRRAMAVAQEQEMKARVQEMRAKLVEAESQVPQAIAEAFRSGRLGVMDYYQMRNVVADTDMRQSIAQATAPATTPEKKKDE
ncbi:MAG: flotillin-like protein FloA [Myxococcota bacterium]